MGTRVNDPVHVEIETVNFDFLSKTFFQAAIENMRVLAGKDSNGRREQKKT